MEAAPPTYEKATLIDYWDIIAGYIPSGDLCSVALVSSRWHAIFVPHLWGNPASHFGIENDRVYVALTRFKRTLQTARLLVRSLTHTLHLPPAHAEIYDGPHADWLRESLERLPNLQSLIVRGLPFFDHGSLQALRHWKPKPQANAGAVELPGSFGLAFQAPTVTVPSFGLRLLDASRCSNVTSSGLASALRRFESLLYLDLSFTYPARDTDVLATMRKFTGLQVLKLRGVSLRDDQLEVLAPAIGHRVRSLDIRDNQVTDRGVRTLLDYCFAQSAELGNGTEVVSPDTRSPALLPFLGTEMLAIYRGEDFEGYLRDTFTGSFISRLAIEDAPEGGVTHLYISNNHLTVEGASGLVRSGRLHVFDLGTVINGSRRQPTVTTRSEDGDEWTMPGAEKLVPVLHKHASNGMNFLRIGHSVVTKDAPNVHTDEVVPNRVELADTGLPVLPRDAAELCGTRLTPEAFELPCEPLTVRYELPGDSMQFIVSPAVNDARHPFGGEDLDCGAAPSDVRRGSALAPEVVDSLVTQTDHVDLLGPVPALGEGTMTSGFQDPGSIASAMASAAPSPAARPRTYSSVASDRKIRLKAHLTDSHSLHPAMVPHVRSLMLTDLPVYSASREVSDRLIRFVKHCAEEDSLARMQAKLDYSLPPGRKGETSSVKHSADKIFGLKRLVLEMAPEQRDNCNSRASPWQHTTSKSMTEDRDSEALWSAAETDFSFFGEGEECGLPSLEPGRHAHGYGSSEKEVNFSNGYSKLDGSLNVNAPETLRFDNIALLSAFRKERKLARQRSLATGVTDPETEGYWDGVITILRPSSSRLSNSEEIDYFGNKFEKGYLYR